MTNEIFKPEWLLSDNKVDEKLFALAFLTKHDLKYINNKFYDCNGLLPSEDCLKKEIYDELSTHLKSGAARKTGDILNVLKMEAFSQPLPIQSEYINLHNGTLHLDGEFIENNEVCLNRLPVNYNPDAPDPCTWLSFLSDLLEPEDIPTLQEFMGYCLIPETRAQKMLMIIGNGGEGKSRVGRILREILGDNMNTTSIQKLEKSEFSRADLEGKLLMLDDDMDLSALPKTNLVKTIVTAEGKMDLERKGIQSYQGQLYVKLMCLGNGALTSLHDRSDGFFRRQIILTTKDKDPDRVDDAFLTDALLLEKEGILLWMLEGLFRLRENKYQFTISQRASDNVKNAMVDANNIIEFMKAADYVVLDGDSCSATADLYAVYSEWCNDNAEIPLKLHSFSSYLSRNTNRYHLVASNNIIGRTGRRSRGYWGIQILRQSYSS